MKDSNKWWAVLFIAIVCVFLGVHATLDLVELRGSIDERLGSIDESLAEMNQTLAERARTTPSLGLQQVEDKILRQMVIDKALNGVASPFSIEAVQQE